MKYWPLFLLTFLLFSCTSKSAPNVAPPSTLPATRSSLPDLGEAPELTNEVWLNVDQPLRLADLRGRVVLIDMWTFG
jgi:hypothetical protein